MKILFFGIQYHGYTSAIIEELERLGGDVTFVDLQPRSIGYKVMRTLARPTFDEIVRGRLAEAVEIARPKVFDKVLFLQAHQMPIDLLEDLRHSQKAAEFSLYNWDAITTHDYRAQAVYFDRVLTFDRQDAKVNGYHYLPLFCIRRWQQLAQDLASPRSVYMVGNIVRLERYFAVEKFRKVCRSDGIVFREHLKISPIVLAEMIRLGKLPVGVSLKSISQDRFEMMIETSLAAFDFANHQQSGQTMRMIESLCSGKKIITNNHWVKSESFYSPDRIHVLQGEDYSNILEFLEQPLEKPRERFPEYHIQSFTRKFLGLDEPDSRQEF